MERRASAPAARRTVRGDGLTLIGAEAAVRSDRTTGVVERMTGNLARRGERAAGHIHPRAELLAALAQVTRPVHGLP
jgi:hypothetical protein